jgi:DeoR family fructose operon transcriptional repressor
LTSPNNLSRMSRDYQLGKDSVPKRVFPVSTLQRRRRVLELISHTGFTTLSDLASAVRASESTVRRDLDHWERKGLVKRSHGGATFVGDGAGLPALEERTSLQIEEKRLIARLAGTLVRDGDAVLLDGGTTTLEVARVLVGRPLQIVTNSLPIAGLFASSRETDLVILGGYVYPKTGVALGPLTVRMLEDIHVHQTFMSVGGITTKGLFNSNLLLVETERAMMRCADQVVVVADHTKVGRQALAFLCELSAVDTLIIDRGLTPEQAAVIDRGDVRVLVAGLTGDGDAREAFES